MPIDLGKIFSSGVSEVKDTLIKTSNYLNLESSGDSGSGTSVGGSNATSLRSIELTNATLEKSKIPSQPIVIFTTNENKGSLYIDNTESATYTSGKITIAGKPAPYSVFNKYSLMSYKGNILSSNKDGLPGGSDTLYQRIDATELINPTASKIIEITSVAGNGKNYGYRYDYSDFALVKYYGKIPNNMMLTLRRFSSPCKDDIITPQGFTKEGSVEDIMQPDIARAITYMGEAPGNSLAEIIKFKHGYSWTEVEAAVQEITAKTGGGGQFGDIVAGSGILTGLANAAAGRDAVASSAKKENAGYDSFKETYPNHVFGPLNVIKSILQREQGLNFDQEFTLKFEYELKSIGGANPKVMMLDQLANILALTYNNAPFWGGSVRFIGNGEVARPLGDLKLLREGKYGDFLGSIMGDMSKMFGNIVDVGKDLIAGKDSKFLNNIIGGSLMKMFNTPQGGQAINSLLTGDPTGQWHLTIGNPLNPIAVIGNLALHDTDISFSGGLGVQDFPEIMTVTITLKSARPRDKAEIESMFNSGLGRFYLQPSDIADINKSTDVSAYGNKDKKASAYVNEFRKITNG